MKIDLDALEALALEVREELTFIRFQAELARTGSKDQALRDAMRRIERSAQRGIDLIGEKQ